MRKILLPVCAAFAAMMATPASAAEVICYRVGNDQPQCANTTTNVLMTGTTTDGKIDTNFNAGGAVTGQFSSTTNTLNAGASGQAVVTSPSGSIGDLTFQLLNGLTFGTATFNLVGTGTVEVSGLVFGIGADGVDFSRSFVNAGNSGLFGITGTDGERFTGFTLTTTAGSLNSLEQLRLADVRQVTAAVPEPGTWAMMLLGFGGVGVSMRRRRSRVLMQVA